MDKKIIFLVGPTAVGKTEIALQLAKNIKVEIIACDSMQVYKGMEIISSAPLAYIRKRFPHHLIAYVSVASEYNVSRYRKAAIRKIKEIIARGKIPLFVGGTGLYFKVLLDGIFPAPGEDKEIRQRLYCQASRCGQEKLYLKLKSVDPLAASRLHPHDLRRIIRALEVYEKTKITISEWQKRCHGLSSDFSTQIFGLIRGKNDLHRRIDQRLETMFKVGLLKEMSCLLRRNLGKTAKQVLGMKEISGYLNGEYDLQTAKELLKQNTYRYVKKQITWFKKDKRINWIRLSPRISAKKVAQDILFRLSQLSNNTLK